MSIFNRSVSDDLTLDENFPDLRFSRQSFSIVEDLYLLDEDVIVGGTKRVSTEDDFYLEDVIVGWNTTIRLSTDDDLFFVDNVIIAGFGRVYVVADNLTFAETVRNNRKVAAVIDTLTFAESRSLHFTNPRLTVTDTLNITEQVIRVHLPNKNNLIVADNLVFHESNVFNNLPHPIVDTLIFTEVVERWTPRQRPSLVESLTFIEAINPQRSRPNTDSFRFGESICICLVLGRQITDSLTFTEQANVFIANRVVPPPDGGLGDGDGIDFTFTLDIDIFEDLNFHEGYVILKNNVNIAERACCA